MSQCLGSASKSLPGSTGLAAGSPLGRRTGVQRDGRRASHPVLCPLYPLSAASNFLARHSAGLALALSQPPGSAGRAWSPAQLHPTLWLCHGLARGRHTLPPCRPPTQPCTGSSALSSCCPGSPSRASPDFPRSSWVEPLHLTPCQGWESAGSLSMSPGSAPWHCHCSVHVARMSS